MNLRPEAVAARAHGARTAHAGRPRSACPHPAGSWLALNWLVGHALETGDGETADVLRKAANLAWKREVRDRARAAREAVKPTKPKGPKPVRVCELEGCEVHLTRKQRGYCSVRHYKLSGAQSAAGAKGNAAFRALKAAQGAARPTPAPAAVAPARPAPRPTVTEEMRRAAYAGMSEVEMRRFLGLDETQVAQVLAWQALRRRVA